MKKKLKKSTKKKPHDESQDESPADAPQESDGDPGHRATISYDDFVRVWSSCNTVSEVAEQLGIKTTSASGIAGRLRKAGVNLKKYQRRSAQVIDVKQLNRIAKGGD